MLWPIVVRGGKQEQAHVRTGPKTHGNANAAGQWCETLTDVKCAVRDVSINDQARTPCESSSAVDQLCSCWGYGHERRHGRRIVVNGYTIILYIHEVCDEPV